MDPNQIVSELRGTLRELGSETKRYTDRRFDEIATLINAPGGGTRFEASVKSLAEFIRNDSGWQEWAKVGKGRFAKMFQAGEVKDLISESVVGSATPGILVPERIPGIRFAGVPRLRIRDLLPVMPTSNNAVDFVRENAFTNAAYPQVEGDTKGESALTFQIASAPVRTVAHWIPASRQVLDDWAELRAAIDFRLLSGLADREDYELLRGDGSGDHLTGLLAQSTAFDTSKEIPGDTYIDRLSQAIEQLENLNRVATGIVLNPSDWRKITRIKNEAGGANTGFYLIGSPIATTAPNLWGVPIAVTTSMPPAEFLVGDFARGATLFDRLSRVVEVSDQHSDYFVRNLLAIRAEERIALAVYRSDYFVYGNF